MFFQGFFLLFTFFSIMILVNYTKMTNILYIFWKIAGLRPSASGPLFSVELLEMGLLNMTFDRPFPPIFLLFKFRGHNSQARSYDLEGPCWEVDHISKSRLSLGRFIISNILQKRFLLVFIISKLGIDI